MSTISFSEFQQAFYGVLPIEKREVCGRLRAVGGAKGVGIDLLLASFNGDYVQSAALQLAYVDGNTEFDQFSLSCLRCFLRAVLEDVKVAETWMEAAFTQLLGPGVTSCTTTHDGFSLRLLQQKPYQMFLVTATDEESPNQ